MVANKKRKEIITELIEDARKYRFCGPSDNPDEQTAVTSGYRYLVTQFKRLAAPVLASPSASRLNTIEVEIGNLYSASDAKAELDALLREGHRRSCHHDIWQIQVGAFGTRRSRTPRRIAFATSASTASLRPT
jgi:hypothetical protein